MSKNTWNIPLACFLELGGKETHPLIFWGDSQHLRRTRLQADRMLDMGFEPEIAKILAQAFRRQSCPVDKVFE